MDVDLLIQIEWISCKGSFPLTTQSNIINGGGLWRKSLVPFSVYSTLQAGVHKEADRMYVVVNQLVL